jgi:hypothetical protein
MASTPIAGRITGWHRPLLVFAGAMAVLAVVAATGLLVDSRVVDGMPIWAKPLKFSLSFVLYAFVWAWLFSLQRRARPWGSRLGTALVAASALEMVIIVTQVVRGKRSHFNDATELDATLFRIMGLTIIILFVANLIWAILVLRDQTVDRNADPSTDRSRTNAWALRLGLTISTVGMSLGALMLGPTPAQRAGIVDDVVGGHSVGVLDGGPGLPLLGWSTTGGDLRIPHFVGMHALQLLPLLALLLIAASRRFPVLRDDRTRARLIVVAGGGYAGLLAVVAWQALRGQPLISPDGVTLGALGLVVLLVAVGAAGALVRTPSHATPAPTPEVTPSATVTAGTPNGSKGLEGSVEPAELRPAPSGTTSGTAPDAGTAR